MRTRLVMAPACRPPESGAPAIVSREVGVTVQTLEQWRDNTTQALAEPEEVRASPQQNKQDRRRIKKRAPGPARRPGPGRDDGAAGAVTKAAEASHRGASAAIQPARSDGHLDRAPSDDQPRAWTEPDAPGGASRPLAHLAAFRPVETCASDLQLMRRIDELHLQWPFMGSRMLRDTLRLEGPRIGR